MRIAAVLFALAVSATVTAQTIADEFSAGFGGVPWGTEFSALVTKLPGGYTAFSNSPGRVCYIVNIEDPVLGISRRAQYVVFGIATDGRVDHIEIQVPYDQTSTLISILTSKLGPEKSIEGKGVITIYRWPPNKEVVLVVRTTKNKAYGLTTLDIGKMSEQAMRGLPVESPANMRLSERAVNKVPEVILRRAALPLPEPDYQAMAPSSTRRNVMFESKYEHS